MQDYPGRTKLWHVGVPPSGPMDALAFRLANALVGNEESAAGLEITLSGAPTARALQRTHLPALHMVTPQMSSLEYLWPARIIHVHVPLLDMAQCDRTR